MRRTLAAGIGLLCVGTLVYAQSIPFPGPGMTIVVGSGPCGSNTMTAAYRADGLGASSWPDTSGNGHNLALGAGSWPTATATFGTNNRTAARFNGSSALENTFSMTAPYYIYVWAVSKQAGTFNKRWMNTRDGVDGVSLTPTDATHMRAAETGITSAAYTDGTAQYFEVTVNGASSNFRINTTGTAGTVTTGQFDHLILGALAASGSSSAQIDLAEACFSASDQNSAMRAYGTLYYGIP